MLKSDSSQQAFATRISLRRLGFVAAVGLSLLLSSTASAVKKPLELSDLPDCAKFAAPNGSDSSRGSRQRPFKTAQRLANALLPGQVGCLRGGTYTAQRPFVLDFSGSGVAVVSYPGETVVLRGIVVDRSGANGVRLAGVKVIGDGSQNTIQVYGSDFTLQGSDISNNWLGRSCMMLGDPSAGTALRPVIRDNRFHQCGNPANGSLDHGIYASSVVGGLITENLFWDMAAYAIQLYPNAQNTVFSHNVVDATASASRGGVIVGGSTSGTPSSGNSVEFNVIVYAPTHNIDAWWGGAAGSGNTARSNCIYGAKQGDTGSSTGLTYQNNLSTDPLFLNRTTHDYRLQSTSPCLPTIGYDTAARPGLKFVRRKAATGS